MALQWSGELHNIVECAERDASRMGTRMNTALLLRSMLKTNSSLQGILPSLGVTLDLIVFFVAEV